MQQQKNYVCQSYHKKSVYVSVLFTVHDRLLPSFSTRVLSEFNLTSTEPADDPNWRWAGSFWCSEAFCMQEAIWQFFNRVSLVQLKA